MSASAHKNIDPESSLNINVHIQVKLCEKRGILGFTPMKFLEFGLVKGILSYSVTFWADILIWVAHRTTNFQKWVAHIDFGWFPTTAYFERWIIRCPDLLNLNRYMWLILEVDRYLCMLNSKAESVWTHCIQTMEPS